VSVAEPLSEDPEPVESPESDEPEPPDLSDEPE
jgi:hypothetical protein